MSDSSRKEIVQFRIKEIARLRAQVKEYMLALRDARRQKQDAQSAALELADLEERFTQTVDWEIWKALTTSGLPNWINAALAYREVVDRVDSGKSITLELKERVDKADALLDAYNAAPIKFPTTECTSCGETLDPTDDVCTECGEPTTPTKQITTGTDLNADKTVSTTDKTVSTTGRANARAGKKGQNNSQQPTTVQQHITAIDDSLDLLNERFAKEDIETQLDLNAIDLSKLNDPDNGYQERLELFDRFIEAIKHTDSLTIKRK